jgi:hypothetical protein
VALTITIAPTERGWTLRAEGLQADLHFRSGGQAETAGRALADRLARAGQAAELEVFLRDGAVAGWIPFPALLAA